MTLLLQAVVKCDGKDCPNSIVGHSTESFSEPKKIKAREEAQRIGWLYLGKIKDCEKKDYCPECRKKMQGTYE